MASKEAEAFLQQVREYTDRELQHWGKSHPLEEGRKASPIQLDDLLKHIHMPQSLHDKKLRQG
jgi:hypothetical protein